LDSDTFAAVQVTNSSSLKKRTTMKTSFFTLAAVLLVTFAVQAQDVATNLSSFAELHDAAVSLSEEEATGDLSLQELRATPSSTPGAHPEAVAAHTEVNFNGVNLNVQTLPASGTVLVTFDIPNQQSTGMIELAETTTGKVVFTGSILAAQGQVELPVPDARMLFEVRLSTDHDLIIARMMR
jgi:hypothetical protein